MLRDRRRRDLEGGRDVAGGELAIVDQPQDLAPNSATRVHRAVAADLRPRQDATALDPAISFLI